MTTSYCHRAGAAAAVIVLVVTGARSASPQSLADLARRDEERRKQATPSGRVYTNDSLGAVDAPAAPPAEPAATTAAPTPGLEVAKDPSTAQTSVKPPTAAREKRDEQYWRKLFTDLRARVAGANADLDAERARLEAFRGDESPTGVRQREVLAASIGRLENGVRIQTEELTRYLTRATREKIPEEWTR